MPLQLIHTSAPHLLDSTSAGYGTVARSEALSKALCTRLTALSIMREPKGKAATTGPQFSYSVIDHAGVAWHVLSCVQNAGADYSGRGCHIAHHLVFHQDEIHTLLSSILRPTPSGITLALYRTGFWCAKWEGAPRFLNGEPELSPEDLPDASNQPTWKRLTQHKSNARAFYTAPFHRDCLVTVPRHTPSTDVLQLFHESDWLTQTRGWGVTYTTEADDADSYAETLRMVTVPDSPLVQKAIRTGHPVLSIGEGMELPLPCPAGEPPLSAPLSPAQKEPFSGDMIRAIARSVSHYHYTEEPDWLMFDVRPGSSGGRSAALATCGIAAVAMLGAWCLYTPEASVPLAEAGPEHTSALPSVPDNVYRLAQLLQARYHHESAAELINQLSAIAENTPEDSLILESAAILQNARQSGTRHAAAIKRLCECARLLGLKDSELALLYLRESTHGTTPAEWKKQFDGNQLTDWLTLKQSEPQLMPLMNTPELKDYMPLPSAPATTILATADTAPAPAEEDTQEQPVQQGRVSLIPSTAVSGAPLPPELEKLIPTLPVSISTGAFVVSCFDKGGELQPAQRLELSPPGYRLYITPTEKPGEFLLKPEHADGNPSPVPACTLTIRNGSIHRISCEGREAVVCFPVPSKEDFHTNIILASTFAIPLPRGKGLTLPPAAEAGLDVSPDNLEFVTASIATDAPKVRLCHKKTFPWVINKRHTERSRFTIKLPVLTGHNSMQQTGGELSTYTWDEARVSKETDSVTTVHCEVEHLPDLPRRLERAFELVMNSPGCGEFKSKDKSLTLGHLYYICCALANEKLTNAERRKLYQAYFNLFANKQFNQVLMRIFANDTMLHLTPQEAGSNHLKSLKIRNNIKKLLSNRGIRDLIRRRICEVLTRTLYAAYTQEQQELEKKKDSPPLFLLRNIAIGDHGELLWQFSLQSGK